MNKFILFLTIFFLLTEKSYAYLGPGLGFGILGLVMSFFGAIFILIYGFFFKIFKYFKLKKSKKKKD